MANKTKNVVARGRRRAFLGALLVWLPGIALVTAGFVIAWSFIEPAPPTTLRLATGAPTGSYAAHGRAYAETFARDGIELEVVHTGGTVDNLRLLAEGAVDAAIVQGGVKAPEPTPLQGISALYYEPLMMFHRGAVPANELSALAGGRVAIGGEGSGSRFAALELLEAAGLTDRIEALPLGGVEAVEALERGAVDGVFMVTSPDNPLVARLLSTPDIHIVRLRRAEAFARRLPHLTPVTLPRGVVDLSRDLPATDVPLLAATAALVARADLHDALPPVLIDAARAVHGHGSLLSSAGTFPALAPLDYPVERETRHAFESGRSFLYRVLPFWAASLVDRLKILLLPLLTLLIPLFRVAPPLYRWRIRSRIYRWYKVLRGLDAEIAASGHRAALEDARVRVRALQRELHDIDVPVSYMDEFYHLRLHADLVQRRLEQRLSPPERRPADDDPSTPPTPLDAAHDGGDPPSDDEPPDPPATGDPGPGDAPPLRPTAGARRIVRRHVVVAATLGLAPLPLVDLATTTAVSLAMLRRLAGYYGTPFRADLGKSAIAALTGGAAAGGGALGLSSAAKAVPVVGSGLAIVAGPAATGAVTYAMGRVFIAHFGTGGTLFDFDPERYRDHFQTQVAHARGEAVSG